MLFRIPCWGAVGDEPAAICLPFPLCPQIHPTPCEDTPAGTFKLPPSPQATNAAPQPPFRPKGPLSGGRPWGKCLRGTWKHPQGCLGRELWSSGHLAVVWKIEQSLQVDSTLAPLTPHPTGEEKERKGQCPGRGP